MKTAAAIGAIVIGSWRWIRASFATFQINTRLLAGRIEHIDGYIVKALMDRVRIVFCSLLSALLVLAAGCCLADPVSGRPDGCRRASASETGHCCHAPLTDVRSSAQSARLLNRRMGMQAGWGVVPAPVAISPSGLDDSEHAPAPPTIATEALGLAKCWQFYWRTASEPRAPSSVS